MDFYFTNSGLAYDEYAYCCKIGSNYFCTGVTTNDQDHYKVGKIYSFESHEINLMGDNEKHLKDFVEYEPVAYNLFQCLNALIGISAVYNSEIVNNLLIDLGVFEIKVDR